MREAVDGQMFFKGRLGGIERDSDRGGDLVVVVSDDGRKGTYKREGNTLQISGDQSVTLTMQGNIPDPPTAGFTAPYTSSIGTSGTMTIVSIG